MSEKEAPFTFSDIEDVRIIVRAKGKNYAIAPKPGKFETPEEAREIRKIMLSVLLEDHNIVVPSLEEIDIKNNK